MIQPMTLGERVRLWRNHFEWTLDQLAERSGVERGTIGAIEVRKSTRSTFGPALAKAFGLTYEELLDPQVVPSAPYQIPQSSDFPSTILAEPSAIYLRQAPVMDWGRLGEDLSKPNDQVKSDRQITVPDIASRQCKWVICPRDYPRFRIRAGNLICFDANISNHKPVEDDLYLFRKGEHFVLAEYRGIAEGSFEAIPHEGPPLERDRHGLSIAAIVRGVWRE